MTDKVTLVLAYVNQDRLDFVKSNIVLGDYEMDTSTMTWYCYAELNDEPKSQAAYEFLKNNAEFIDNSWLSVGARCKRDLPIYILKTVNELGISVRESHID